MTEPYEYCRKCNGEGIDLDPYGLFDYPCFGACDECKKWEMEDGEEEDGEEIDP